MDRDFKMAVLRAGLTLYRAEILWQQCPEETRLAISENAYTNAGIRLVKEEIQRIRAEEEDNKGASETTEE